MNNRDAQAISEARKLLKRVEALENLSYTPEEQAARRARFEQLKAEQEARRKEAERTGKW